jgi:predicted RNA-binding Zn-ribbon protein involved in translation (DUF1610 family)
MVALFGPSEQDLERLRATVESLGTTSVPGLAAALSWRERKAEKLLAHELARPNTKLAYDPARRVVRWARPPPAVPAPSDRSPPRPDVRDPASVAPRAPAPVLAGTALKTLCPTCHVALIPTGSASLAVCPQCGRLASARGGGATSAAPPSTAASVSGAVTVAPAAAATPLNFTDRRSQEMFAAYVTSRPIPCPKCRTPLRHRGPSEYVCPSCAQAVQFPRGTVAGPGAAAPTPESA